MRSRPFLTFVLVTFGFSWTLWGLMILSARGLLPFRFPTSFVGSFGPLVGAWVATRLSREPGGPRGLVRSLAAWRVPPLWYVVSLVGPAVVMLTAAVVVSAIGGAMPRLQHLDRWYLAFPVGLLILVVGGPLGEEVGWRGYLLPRLQARLGPLLASGAIAVIWLLWHLPLFELEGAAQEGGSLLAFGLSVLAFSLLFTWVYNRTEGSLLLAVLLHTGINTPSLLASAVAPSLVADPRYEIALVGLFGATALAVVVATRGRLGQGRRGPSLTPGDTAA